EGDWIRAGVEHNGNGLRSPFDQACDRGAHRIDHVDFLMFEINRCLLHHPQIASAVAHVKNDLSSLFDAYLSETLPEPLAGAEARASVVAASGAMGAGLRRLDGGGRSEGPPRQGPEEHSAIDHSIT